MELVHQLRQQKDMIQTLRNEVDSLKLALDSKIKEIGVLQQGIQKYVRFFQFLIFERRSPSSLFNGSNCKHHR